MNIQFQPQRATNLVERDVVCRLQEFARTSAQAVEHSTECGTDRGRYVNFQISTANLSALWDEIQSLFLKDAVIGAALSNSTIVTCQGTSGWNDYLLLHHFDGSLKRDRLEPV